MMSSVAGKGLNGGFTGTLACILGQRRGGTVVQGLALVCAEWVHLGEKRKVALLSETTGYSIACERLALVPPRLTLMPSSDELWWPFSLSSYHSV